MLEKLTVIDRIEVTEAGHIQVRHAIRIMEDGKQLSQSFHRYALAPGDNLEGQEARVVAIANAVWTEEVVAAYNILINKTII